MGEILIAGHGLDADHDLPRAEIHRIPAGARVRPAHPRGRPAGAPRQGGHADDGRPDHLRRDLRPLPGALRTRRLQPRRLRRRDRLRRARLRRRLHQDHQTALARPLRPLQAARPAGPRARPLVGRAPLGRPRTAPLHPDRRRQHLPRPGPLLRARLPGHRRHLQRGQPDRRPRRPRRRLLRDRPPHLHRDRLRRQRPEGPGAALAAAWSAPASDSSGTTPSRPRSSWGTPARSASAGRSGRWR